MSAYQFFQQRSSMKLSKRQCNILWHRLFQWFSEKVGIDPTHIHFRDSSQKVCNNLFQVSFRIWRGSQRIRKAPYFTGITARLERRTKKQKPDNIVKLQNIQPLQEIQVLCKIGKDVVIFRRNLYLKIIVPGTCSVNRLIHAMLYFHFTKKLGIVESHNFLNTLRFLS